MAGIKFGEFVRARNFKYAVPAHAHPIRQSWQRASKFDHKLPSSLYRAFAQKCTMAPVPAAANSCSLMSR